MARLRLVDAGAKFQTTIKTVTGKQFSGLVIETPGLRNATGHDAYYLRVGQKSVAAAGDIVNYDSQKYLLGLAADEMVYSPLFRFYRMILANKTFTWMRVTTSIDPVSHLPKETGETNLGTIYAALLANGTIFDVFRVPTSKFHLVTHVPLQINDRLAELTVTFVEFRLGLWFCEVR